MFYVGYEIYGGMRNSGASWIQIRRDLTRFAQRDCWRLFVNAFSFPLCDYNFFSTVSNFPCKDFQIKDKNNNNHCFFRDFRHHTLIAILTNDYQKKLNCQMFCLY